jgi:hypothetical protein
LKSRIETAPRAFGASSRSKFRYAFLPPSDEWIFPRRRREKTPGPCQCPSRRHLPTVAEARIRRRIGIIGIGIGISIRVSIAAIGGRISPIVAIASPIIAPAITAPAVIAATAILDIGDLI